MTPADRRRLRDAANRHVLRMAAIALRLARRAKRERDKWKLLAEGYDGEAEYYAERYFILMDEVREQDRKLARALKRIEQLEK